MFVSLAQLCVVYVVKRKLHLSYRPAGRFTKDVELLITVVEFQTQGIHHLEP